MEKVINIFPIFENQILTCIGFRIHEIDGSDEEKIEFLKSRVETDVNEMVLTLLPENFTVKLPDGSIIPGITLERYNILLNNGTEGVLFEGIYQAFDFPENPLQILTPVVNGELKFHKSLSFDSEVKAPFITKIHEEIPKHYLDEFMTEQGFELVNLIEKDFFGAIKLTFNEGHYVSCLKLLLSAVDSIAYLEYGDRPQRNIFRDWLTTYCDFSKLNIDDAELWEYRNSLLHMTNAYSRKVAKEIVKRLSFYISNEDKNVMTGDGQSKYFNIKSLIEVISGGIDTWAETFNEQKEKVTDFFDRYDLIISDSRYHKVQF